MPKSNSPLRLVIDTNLWISFLISGKQRKLDNLLSLEKVKILFGAELIEEITRSAKHPKLKEYFNKEAVEEMFTSLEPYIDFIEVKSVVNICRDTKDNFLLALSKDGNANFLLTGDKDLLVLFKIGKTKIITISQFFDEIRHFS